MTKCENFRNSRWRTAAILKIVLDHNSAADCSILVFHRITVTGQIPAFYKNYFLVFIARQHTDAQY